ncbi:MAG: hypothetical protein JO020_32505 [Chloroflexi bacterium]|nr:hypothetical protein [Chloroflexota bacterium]
MSTQSSTSAVFGRVVARTGAGLWRHRGGVLLALALSAACVGYTAFSGVSLGQPLALGAASPTSSDCADTAMAAIADKSPTAAQRAYQCMDPSFQQRVPEQTFIQQLQAQALPNVSTVSRVGDYRSQTTGGEMVYYAVDANGQSVGYIVYLGQTGKVLRIE